MVTLSLLLLLARRLHTVYGATPVIMLGICRRRRRRL